ncbi:MAG TPA: sigma-70 family RNA polymerase sigma factor [Pirellulales bacterium]|jgi:RNA polymerase sigma-70 factor (ECF subfamily)
MSNPTNNTAPLDEPSDEALVAQLVAGSQEAIVPLLVRYSPRVLGLASTAVDRAAAEEVVQEVFVAVWRGAATFDPAKGSFRNWLLQITRNRIANELRRRGRRTDSRTVDDEAAWMNVTDVGPDPSEAAWHDFRRQVLRSAVDELPLKQRQALSLAFFDELTHQQVAAALDVPLGTAKTRIRSALDSLRQRLAPMMASLLAFALVLSGATWYLHRQSLELDRQQRALWLVTSSDIVPVRMEAAGGIDPKTHGSYRGRSGEPLAVFTFSNFAQTPAGKEYRLWAKVENRWIDLGNPTFDAAGNARMVVENAALAKPPEALEVTLEKPGARQAESPSSEVQIAWPTVK